MEVSYQAINRYSCTGAFSYVALQLPKFLNYAASFCQSAVNCKLDNIVSTFLINYQKFFENPRMSDGIDNYKNPKVAAQFRGVGGSLLGMGREKQRKPQENDRALERF